MKKTVAVLLACLLLLLCACGSAASVKAEKPSSMPGYEATYHITAVSGTTNLAYDATYSLLEQDGKLLFLGEAVSGDETISLRSELSKGENTPFGMPLALAEEYVHAQKQEQYRKITVEFDPAIRNAIITVDKYKQGAENNRKQTAYSVSLTDGFFDKESLPFLLYTIPGQAGSLYLFAANRDRLQRLYFEVQGQETLTLDCGSFVCTKVRLRPDTAFSSYSATVWYNDAGVPVKVKQNQSEMTLASVKNV